MIRGVVTSMRNHLRLTASTLALVTIAACSRSSDKPSIDDDLKNDLAMVGGSDVQLAGSNSRRLEVVSASERTNAPTAAPKAPERVKAPSAVVGKRAPVVRPKAETPVAAPATTDESAPAEAPKPEPTIVPQPSAPSQSPNVHTNREPRGGWKTPGQIIRNAPFPINP